MLRRPSLSSNEIAMMRQRVAHGGSLNDREILELLDSALAAMNALNLVRQDLDDLSKPWAQVRKVLLRTHEHVTERDGDRLR